MRAIRIAILLIASLLIAYCLLALLSVRLNYSFEYNVNKDVEKSFRTLINPFQFKQWIPGFKSIKPLSGNPASVSAENIMVVEFRGKDRNVFQTITKYEKNKTFACTFDAGTLVIQCEISLSSVESATLLVTDLSLRSDRFFLRPVLWFGKGRIRKELDSVFKDLVHVIETGNNTILFY